MKKDITRDYATDAFRLYAVMKKPTYFKARQDIYDKALLSCKSNDPQAILNYAEEQVDKRTPMLLDILAVQETISMLKKNKKDYIIKAIENVYFVSPNLLLRKGDIQSRVIKMSCDSYVSERAIYKWLREARQLFSALRGLRIDNYKSYENVQ